MRASIGEHLWSQARAVTVRPAIVLNVTGTTDRVVFDGFIFRDPDGEWNVQQLQHAVARLLAMYTRMGWGVDRIPPILRARVRSGGAVYNFSVVAVGTNQVLTVSKQPRPGRPPVSWMARCLTACATCTVGVGGSPATGAPNSRRAPWTAWRTRPPVDGSTVTF